MQKIYFKFDTEKRLNEIMNAIAVLNARKIELDGRLKRTDLPASEYLAIAEEFAEGLKQIQSYKEELNEIAKMEILRMKMLKGEL